MTTHAETLALPRVRRRRYAGLPTIPAMVRRLETLAATATDEQREAGTLWYARFHRVAETLADRYGVTVGQAAGVLAILSPRVSVTRSVELARDLLATREAGGDPVALAGLSDRLDAADRYLDGDPAPLALDTDERLTEARKVRSFWRNILGDPDAVTLDTWALRAVGATREVARGGAYVAAAHAYRLAARRLGLTPRDLQAIVWCTIRGDVDASAELDALIDVARAPASPADAAEVFVSPV